MLINLEDEDNNIFNNQEKLEELEDDEYNIYNDEEKIILMNKDEFKDYLDDLDKIFLEDYGENPPIPNEYLYQLFIIICKIGNEQLYVWLTEFREYEQFSCIKGYFECLKNNHVFLYKKIILEYVIINQVDLLHNLSLDSIEIGNLEVLKWLYSLDKFDYNKNDKCNINYLNLMTACIHNHFTIAKWIFENYKDTIDLSNNNYHLITMSCSSNNIDIIKWLLTLCPNIIIDDIINDAFRCSRNCDFNFSLWLYSLTFNKNNITDETF